MTKERLRRVKRLGEGDAGRRGHGLGRSGLPPPPGLERDRAQGARDHADAGGLGAADAGGGQADPSSSILKIKGSEIQQQATQLLVDVAGPYAAPRPDRAEEGLNLPSVGPEWADAAAPLFFNYRKVSIYGGSNEIQRNIIAKAFLGL
jgi:alkylation response protein AidB-like acyl-CoA dehydrogenase